MNDVKSLREVKKLADEHLKRELDIMEEILKLNNEDARTFYRWYMEHPYRKGIEEVVNIVRRRRTDRASRSESTAKSN